MNIEKYVQTWKIYSFYRREVIYMCMNCGCGIPNDDMGNPKNILLKEIVDRMNETAPENGNTLIQEMENMVKMLNEEIEKMKKAS